MQRLSDRVTAGYQVGRQEVVDALGWQMRRIERGNNVSGGHGGDVTQEMKKMSMGQGKTEKEKESTGKV